MTDFSKRAFQFYIDRGLPPHQAAALAGHAEAESGGKPTIQETLANGKPGPGYGIFQLTTPSRRAGLDTFAAGNEEASGRPRGPVDPKAESTQLDYALHEMHTSEKDAGNKFFASKNYQQAHDAMLGFLRPQGYTPDNPAGSHNNVGRYNNGAELLALPNMATTLAMPPSQYVAPAPDWQQYNTPVPIPPPVAPADTPLGVKGLLTARTDPSVDNSGLRQGMSLIAAGQPQQTWTPSPPSLLAPHRGEDVPLNYLRTRLGLLG